MKTTDSTYNNAMVNFLINSRYRIYRHLLLGLSVMIVSANTAFLSFPYNCDIASIYSLGLVIIYLGIAYFNLYILVPRYLLRNRYWMYIGTLTGVVLLSITIDILAEFYLKKYFGFDLGEFSVLEKPDTFLLNMIATSFLYIICFAGISIGILFKHWFTSAQQINELEKSTIQAELQRLKNQVHPDFLFGTLDKAGELATQDSARTSNILIKLSRFLRYQLYDSTRNEVVLSSEIASLENLLSLKKEQLKDFKYSMTIDDESKQLLVPPLLFVSLLLLVIEEIEENENNPYINLSFNINEHLLEFTCIGTTFSDLINSGDFFNIKRRLDLLFGENYKLDLGKEERLQTIYLSFNLS